MISSTITGARRVSDTIGDPGGRRHGGGVRLDKTMIQAVVDGHMGPFTLRLGDCVNPILRPAGMLIPTRTGALTFKAGFGQIAAPVPKAGMTADMAGSPRPFEVIPLIVTQMQGAISFGPPRQTDNLVDPNRIGQPGFVAVHPEPRFEGGTDSILPVRTVMVSGGP